MTERAELEAVLEALLFAAGEPVSRDRLLAVFDEPDRAAAAEALVSVLDRYRSADGRGVLAEEVAGGVRLVTRPELHPYLQRFFEASGRSRLSMAALETLAIVAYRQPVTAPEIQELRGVSSTGVLKTLLDRHLVRIAGRKEVVGKPFLYCTSKEFLVQFGLKSLAELPPLEEFEEMLGIDGDADVEPPPAVAGGEAETDGGRLAEAGGEPDEAVSGDQQETEMSDGGAVR